MSTDSEGAHRASLHIMATQVAARAVEQNVAEMWEQYPDIGEGDWNWIVAKAQTMIPTLPKDMVNRAYKVLGELANQDEPFS